jgi:hypothetical protein
MAFDPGQDIVSSSPRGCRPLSLLKAYNDLHNLCGVLSCTRNLAIEQNQEERVCKFSTSHIEGVRKISKTLEIGVSFEPEDLIAFLWRQNGPQFEGTDQTYMSRCVRKSLRTRECVVGLHSIRLTRLLSEKKFQKMQLNLEAFGASKWKKIHGHPRVDPKF